MLVVNEAQQLLEMAEPAWQYDQYNKIYEVMEQDYQLQSRLKALELKVSRSLLLLLNSMLLYLPVQAVWSITNEGPAYTQLHIVNYLQIVK